MRSSLCLLSVSLISFAPVVQLASSGGTRFILAISFPLGLHRNQSLISCLHVLQTVIRLFSRIPPTSLRPDTRVRGLWKTETWWPSYASTNHHPFTTDGETVATLIAPTARTTPLAVVTVPPARPREASRATTVIGMCPATSNAPVRHCLTGHSLVYFWNVLIHFTVLLMLSSTQIATIAIWCNFFSIICSV